MFFFTLQPKKLYAQQTNKRPHSSDIWEILSSGDPVQHSPGEWLSRLDIWQSFPLFFLFANLILSCLEIWQSFHFSFFICQSYSVLARSLENISIVLLLFGNLFLAPWHLPIFFFRAKKLGNHILSPFWHFGNFACSSLLQFGNHFLCRMISEIITCLAIAIGNTVCSLSFANWQSLLIFLFAILN